MISRALRLIRLFHDLSQVQLAKNLGVSNSYISEIEKGKKSPSMELLHRYSDHFNIPISSIMFFAENVESNKSKKVHGKVANRVLTMLELIEDSEGRNDPEDASEVSA